MKIIAFNTSPKTRIKWTIIVRHFCLLSYVVTLCHFQSSCQESQYYLTQEVFRINILNPGFEYEFPTSNKSTFSLNIGIGYSGAYPETTYTGFQSGFIYLINPFLDVQQKWFYNLDKRLLKQKTIDHNSGNFVSARLFIRGQTIRGNRERTTDFDFAIGPTWGIQRKYGKNFHFLFDFGPIIYFDTIGNIGFWPLILQVNLGFDLTK